MSSETIKAWTPRIAMLMLAFAASIGVYRFNLMFFPWWGALATASAFELVYLGLAVIRGRLQAVRQKATILAYVAAGVSIVYNTLDGLFHLRPELLENKPLWADMALAFIHGAPMALIAISMSLLILHEAGMVQKAAPKTSQNRTGGRPKTNGYHRLLEHFDTGELFKRRHVVTRLRIPPASASRLLDEAKTAGVIVQTAQGYQRV